MIIVRDLDEVRAMIRQIGAGLPAAATGIANDLAFHGRKAAQARMKVDLDRPTPWSINRIIYSRQKSNTFAPSTTDRAAVFFDTPFAGVSGLTQGEWLGVQIFGGETAGPRRSEILLRNAGYMTAGQTWVPAVGAPLDAYGNMPGHMISDMVNSLRLTKTGQGDTWNKKFIPIGEPGNFEGVWRLVRGVYEPFIWFVDRATYRPRYDFYGSIEAEALAKFNSVASQRIQTAFDRGTR